VEGGLVQITRLMRQRRRQPRANSGLPFTELWPSGGLSPSACELAVVYTYIHVSYMTRVGIYSKLKHRELHLYSIVVEKCLGIQSWLFVNSWLGLLCLTGICSFRRLPTRQTAGIVRQPRTAPPSSREHWSFRHLAFVQIKSYATRGLETLDPIDHSLYTWRLQEKLFALHADANNVLPLQIVAR